MLHELRAMTERLGSDAFIGSFRIYFDHGLLMIEDADSRAVHDEWDDSTSLINVRADSLCLRTQTYVDGPVAVYLLKIDPGDALGHRIFTGSIATPSGKMRIEDSDVTIRLKLPVQQSVSHIAVIVDDLTFVECAAIVIT